MENHTSETWPDRSTIPALRARLIELGRQGGMKDVEIRLALRAGSVAQIAGGSNKFERRVSTETARTRDEVTEAFLAELAKTAWPAVTLEDITSGSRLKAYCWPRHVLVLLYRQLTNMTLAQMGEATCRADHTSAFNSVRRAARVMQSEWDLASAYRATLARFSTAGAGEVSLKSRPETGQSGTNADKRDKRDKETGAGAVGCSPKVHSCAEE